jgi:hypothetical protein
VKDRSRRRTGSGVVAADDDRGPPPPRWTRAVARAAAVTVVVAAAAGGAVVGAAGMAAVQDARSAPPSDRPVDEAPDAPGAGATDAGASGPRTAPAGDDHPGRARDDRPGGPATESTAAAAPEPAVLLAWTPDGLDPGLVAAAEGGPGVTSVSVARAGVVDLVGTRDASGTPIDTLDDGWAIPLDAVAVDPARHAEFAPGADRAALAALGPGEALLGATSAALRSLGPGGVVDLRTGGSVVVAAVVSDTAIGGAELAVDLATGERLGLTTDRYLLVGHDGDRAEVETRLRDGSTPGTQVRFRGPGETPYLRHADAVLPQVRIKERFGEFAYRRLAGDGFVQDPAWQAANLVTVDLPLIGEARCHRGVVDALTGALEEVAARSLAGLIDPGGFAGCWNPRTTRAGTTISRHAWGVAVDLNFGQNPTGLSSVQDPRLLEIFARWGFTDGSRWLIPDAGHFEYVTQPRS